MVRRSLSEALGPVPVPEPAPAQPQPQPQPQPQTVATPEPAATTAPLNTRLDASSPPDRYKLTVILDENDHLQLEALTAAVLADVQPRRIGKGWRTKVVRALLAEALAADGAPDPRVVKRISRRLRET